MSKFKAVVSYYNLFEHLFSELVEVENKCWKEAFLSATFHGEYNDYEYDEWIHSLPDDINEANYHMQGSDEQMNVVWIE